MLKKGGKSAPRFNKMEPFGEPCWDTFRVLSGALGPSWRRLGRKKRIQKRLPNKTLKNIEKGFPKTFKTPPLGHFFGAKKPRNTESADSRKTEFALGPQGILRFARVSGYQKLPQNPPREHSPQRSARTSKKKQEGPNGSPKSSQNRPRGRQGGPQRHKNNILL